MIFFTIFISQILFSIELQRLGFQYFLSVDKSTLGIVIVVKLINDYFILITT